MINVEKNISLAPLTTFKIGGPAKFFCEVKNEEELVQALDYAKENNLTVFVLGGGSNILVSDEGFNGLVIKIIQDEIGAELRETESSSGEIECWAGNSLSGVVNFGAKNNLTGLEWAAGIPGTIGGAVRGNAGAYGVEMADGVENIKAVDMETKKIINFSKEECNFSYRNSVFKQNKNLIIISAALKLQKGNQVEIESRIKNIIKKRNEKIPAKSSAGSFFENPIVADKNLVVCFEKDTGAKSKEGKIPAGWLIEEAGLCGKKIGNVAVSEKHGNFIVNLGGGMAQEIVMLACLIKMKVRDKWGIELKEEVQYVGFGTAGVCPADKRMTGNF